MFIFIGIIDTAPVPVASISKSSLDLLALILLSINDIADVVKSPVTFVVACNSTVPVPLVASSKFAFELIVLHYFL